MLNTLLRSFTFPSVIKFEQLWHGFLEENIFCDKELVVLKQVLTYAQQTKELSNVEQDKLAKRIQEFRTQAEFNSNLASSDLEPSTSADGIRVVGMTSNKSIEAIMQSAANGEVRNWFASFLIVVIIIFSQMIYCHLMFFELDGNYMITWYSNL